MLYWEQARFEFKWTTATTDVPVAFATTMKVGS